MSPIKLGVGCFLALAACDTGESDASTAGGSDGGEETGQLEGRAEAEEIAAVFETPSGGAAAFGTAFNEGGQGALVPPLPRLVAGSHRVEGGDTPPSGSDEQGVGEQGVTEELVEPPSCVALSWTSLTQGSVTFTDCVLQATGQTVSGTIDLTVSLLPTSITVGLQQLTIDDDTFDGSIALVVMGNGADGGSGATPSSTVTVDLSYVGQSKSLQFDDVVIESASGTAVANGQGMLTTPALSAALTLSDVSWNACLPSSGVLAYESGFLFGTYTFLATTPEDGIVEWRPQGATEPELAMMFTPCT